MAEYNDNAPLGQEVSREEVLTIGVAASEVSQAKNRKMFMLKNISSGGQIISVQLSNVTEAVASTGLVLNVNDVYAESNSEGFKCWSGRIRAISSAAGGSLSIVER